MIAAFTIVVISAVGHPGSFSRLQNEGNLVICTHDMKPAWASKTAARLAGEAGINIQQLRPGRAVHAKRGLRARHSMDLRPRWRLNPGDSLYSPLGAFRLILQDDGNLVLYHIDDERIPVDVVPIVLHTEVSPEVSAAARAINFVLEWETTFPLA